MAWGRRAELLTGTNKLLDRTTGDREHTSMYGRARLGIGLVCLLLCTGCGELGQVTALGGATDGLGRALPGVSGDIFRSCTRRAVLVARIPAAEQPGRLPGLMPDCGPAKAVSAQLGADEVALTAYLRALGKLGTGADFSYGKALSAEVTTANDFSVDSGVNPTLAADSQKAAVAALTLSQKLTDLATRHVRARDVRRVALEANPGIQALTAALYQVGDVDYGIELADERGFLDAYYQGPIAAAQSRERLAVILVQRQYDGDVERLERRQAAAAEYGAVMQQIGVLHAKLAEAARDGAGFEARVKALAPQVDQLQAAVAKLETEVK